MTEPLRWLPHVCALFYGKPWMLPSRHLEHLRLGLHEAMLQRGSRDDPPSLAAVPSPLVGAGDETERPRGYQLNHGVATVPIHGVLLSRGARLAPDSTVLQSYERLKHTLETAHKDPRVRGLLLDLNTPGGMADGVFTLADQIRDQSKVKPVWAVANHEALSAGYVLASAADRVYVARGGRVGSLGVVALHADQSKYDEHEGIRYSYLFRGERKIDGNPHFALSPEARTEMQREVDRVYADLMQDVGRNRRIDPGRLSASEARVYIDDEAIDHGLADSVGTLDQAHAALVQHTTPRARGRTMDDAGSPETVTTAAAMDDNVIQMRVNEALRAARKDDAEVLKLCQDHGHPELAPALLAEGVTPDGAARRILDYRATQAQRRDVTAIDTSAAADAKRRSVSAAEELEKAGQARFEAQRRAYPPWT